MYITTKVHNRVGITFLNIPLLAKIINYILKFEKS